MPTTILEKSAFIHLPKTGGSWVSAAIQNAGLAGRPFNKPAHKDSWARWSHGDSLDLAEIDKFKFAFVRHPAAWWRSFWGYRMRTGWHDWHPIDSACKSDDFHTFIECAIEKLPGYLSTLYTRYVGKVDAPIDFIGKHENLEGDLVTALVRAGEKFNEAALRKTALVNVTAYNRLAVSSEYTADLRRRICESEQVAMNRFNYSTDG